jgi:hypothetical protein
MSSYKREDDSSALRTICDERDVIREEKMEMMSNLHLLVQR